MKILIFFAVIYLISSAFSVKYTVKIDRLANMEHCFEGVDENSTDVMRLLNRDVANPTPKMKDIMRCMYESNNALVNGKMDKDAIKAMIDPGEEEQKADAALEKCTKQANEGESTDPNDVAHRFTECFIDA